MPDLDKIKQVIFGPKPKRTPRYAGVVREWGKSAQTIYRWRNSSYDNLERQIGSLR